MSSWRTLILGIDPDYDPNSVSLRDQIEKCFGMLRRELDHSEDDTLKFLLECALKISRKIPLIGTLVGLLNLENDGFVKRVVETIRTDLERALCLWKIDIVQKLMRFLTVLMCCKVVHPSALLDVYTKMLEHAETIPRRIGYTKFFVNCILSCLLWGGYELIERVPEEIEEFRFQIDAYLSIRWSRFIRDFGITDRKEDFTEYLWGQIQDISNNGWKLDSVPKPHLQFEKLLIAGKSHDLGPSIRIGWPFKRLRGKNYRHPEILFNREKHDAYLNYPQRIHRLDVFPAKKTKGFKVMSSSIESSKQGDRHHQYLRLGLDVRPRLSIVPEDIKDDLAFCFDEKERLIDCLADVFFSDGDVDSGLRALRDLITCEPRICDLVDVDLINALEELLVQQGKQNVAFQAAIVLPRLKFRLCRFSVAQTVMILKQQFLLHSTILQRYEIMRTLTFLAADYPDASQLFRETDILEVVRIYFLNLRSEEYNVIRECANFLSAFCCRNPELSQEKEVVLDIVKSLFQSSDTEGVMPAVCSAFYHLSYQQNMSVNETVVRKLFLLASHHYTWIAIPALMVVGNIVRYGGDRQIQSMITKDMLPALSRLLCNDSKLVQREACWIISNLSATSRIEISSSLLPLLGILLHILVHEESDVRMDAAWSIFNIFTHGYTNITWPERSSGLSMFNIEKRVDGVP